MVATQTQMTATSLLADQGHQALHADWGPKDKEQRAPRTWGVV